MNDHETELSKLKVELNELKIDKEIGIMWWRVCLQWLAILILLGIVVVLAH